MKITDQVKNNFHSLGYKDADGNFLSGVPAWTNHYASWASAQGLGSKVDAFVTGSANMIAYTGLPRSIALIVMGVFVASFAGTTLDTATRIQRYVVSEIASDLKINIILSVNYLPVRKEKQLFSKTDISALFW